MGKNEIRSCIVCRETELKKVFQKSSPFGEIFQLVQCKNCGLQFVHPQPSEDEIRKYYQKHYFLQRTDRGYNNYFSPAMKREIERIIQLNLKDLGFADYEQRLGTERRALDIGCAAGYFVNFMSERGWGAAGIDISPECVRFAQEVLKKNVIRGDYLSNTYHHKFHLITLWATIEHLHHPDRVVKKMYDDLEEKGMLYLTTCRIGGVNFMKLFGKQWRFYNLPEHLYFFSYPTMKLLLEQFGFTVVKYVTYGSGLGKGGSALRRSADFLARRCGMGDMMLIAARKGSP